MLVCLLSAAMLAGSTFASDAAKADIDALRKEFDDLRKQADSLPLSSRTGSVDRALDNRYGPNAPVTTKDGKLKLGLLDQVWFQAYSKDNRGLFDKAGGAAGPDTNEATDNSTYRVRRTEMYFTMDIHENIQAFVNWDPAREAQSYPIATDNQANQSIFKRINQDAPEFDAANGPKLASTTLVSQIQNGTGSPERTLKDAWINYHGVVPHTDFQVGLFKARLGEEGLRNPGELDFAERAMGTFLVDDKQRELGALAHTTWWDDRFQAWLGVLDGAGNFYASAGGGNYNRSDDNNDKDFNYRVLVRPLWNDIHETWWGRMEIGMSAQMGHHGGSGSLDPVDNPVNGLNRERTWATFDDGWFYYAFGKKLSGWWTRAEFEWLKDRNAPGQVADLNGDGVSLGGNAQGNPSPFSTNGFSVSTGYKLSDSIFAEDCDSGILSWLKPTEFCFRYDTFGNVETATQNDPNKTWVYKTTIGSAGINYYIKGHNAKIQAMFNYVRQPDGDAFGFHNVQSNSFIMAWQVYW
jgi:hypothetical protein